MNYRGPEQIKTSRLVLFAIAVPMLLSSLSSWQDAGTPPVPSTGSETDTFSRVIENQKRMDEALNIYERFQKIEVRKTGSDPSPFETKAWRLFPAGPALTKIPVSETGDPGNPQSYRAELEKLVKYLSWLNQQGSAQREAYARASHKKKDRAELMAAARQAFIFTRLGSEPRGDRTLIKYSMIPNPDFKSSLRNAIIFSRVSGFIWIDQQSGELARIEGTVTDDISIAMFLAKVYKGSHFMQERYELAPGLWFPTYEQYDFDGRKYLLPFSIHERTFYSNYKKVGPPAEALILVHTELDNLPNK
jgi:hypothetical protein